MTNDKKETTFIATMDINIFRDKASVELTKKTDTEYYKKYTLSLKKPQERKSASIPR